MANLAGHFCQIWQILRKTWCRPPAVRGLTSKNCEIPSIFRVTALLLSRARLKQPPDGCDVTAHSGALARCRATAARGVDAQNGRKTVNWPLICRIFPVPLRTRVCSGRSVPLRTCVCCDRSVSLRMCVCCDRSVPLRMCVCCDRSVPLRTCVCSDRAVSLRALRTCVCCDRSVPLRTRVFSTC